MLFNSFQFMLFFPLVVALYFLLPPRVRWIMLLAASCYFYMAFVPAYILILFFTILVDYVAGLLIEPAQGQRRRFYLVLSIVANVGVLAFFKYFNFINANLAGLAQVLDWNYPVQPLAWILPIGLSFHTFQSLSYTIEVYRGNQPAERHLGVFALYVMYFPQLVAGPIERPQNLLHQLREPHDFNPVWLRDGLLLMLWGLFKKVVIADRLAIQVNEVFNHPGAYHGLPVLVAAYFFAFQIYCDFSGYSDIARGAAQCMGVRLMVNFRRPYFATSIAEFWQRWHISLSSWFRDYVYIPLGGNRVSAVLWVRNTLAVFLLSGLWHGANWTYVVWGGLHGLYMVIGRFTASWRSHLWEVVGLARWPSLRKFVGVLCTFHLVLVAWFFFRAASLSDVGVLLRNAWQGPWHTTAWAGQRPEEFILAIASLVILISVHLLQRRWHLRPMLSNQPTWIRWGVAYGMILAIVLLGEFRVQPFIYFQF